MKANRRTANQALKPANRQQRRDARKQRRLERQAANRQSLMERTAADPNKTAITDPSKTPQNMTPKQAAQYNLNQEGQTLDAMEARRPQLRPIKPMGGGPVKPSGPAVPANAPNAQQAAAMGLTDEPPTPPAAPAAPAALPRLPHPQVLRGLALRPVPFLSLRLLRQQPVMGQQAFLCLPPHLPHLPHLPLPHLPLPHLPPHHQHSKDNNQHSKDKPHLQGTKTLLTSLLLLKQAKEQTQGGIGNKSHVRRFDRRAWKSRRRRLQHGSTKPRTERLGTVENDKINGA